MGKTTVAKALGEKFNLQYVSGGDVLKEIASECGFKHLVMTGGTLVMA